MCLYGHDIDETTSPVEAALTWGIQKIRRTGGDREGGFPGAERILAELENGAPRAACWPETPGPAPRCAKVLSFTPPTMAVSRSAK